MARSLIALEEHVASLLRCRRCPRVLPPPVSGGAILSEIMLVGQAPGVREPILKRPFAHTAGKTLFRWLEESCGLDEAAVRARIYFAAVLRCFPGKAPGGSDRVPAPDEIAKCAPWLEAELALLKPRLVIPVGKLAITQFLPCEKLHDVIGRKFVVSRPDHSFDVIPLPHPSGASPWHRMQPGKDLLARALTKIAQHPALRAIHLETRKPGKYS
ncbi:MAG: uracil-DNA glycosylase family protein [Verrucomicrobiota bacterium]|nr:uracil-DNA glycosylase family protein [Verrucomicrobiota bacterium]